MQPENTWVLDITPGENTLLYDMIRSCRYNINLAKKSGILVSKGTSQDMLDNFYSLYTVTGKRHGITFRSQQYFKTLIEALGNKNASIYNASLEKNGISTLLAAGILVFSGKKAIYMFGSSGNEYRNLKAPYLLVWQMILDAKVKGCTDFDFFGIAPTDNPNHPWSGITSFKKQFGGQKIDNLGSYDLTFKPLEYQVFKILERIRRH
jgi:lipid II:glycine glycyltransferase (peptidoglycan interpeptide bridge formation enzyme)